MSEIKKVLMERDGMTAIEANELIAEAKDQLMDYLDNGEEYLAEDICAEFFGLEPDYIMELF